MIYPSKLGLSLAGLALLLYLVAMQSQSGLLLLILGVLVGCYVVNLLLASRAARHLHVIPPEAIHGVECEPVRGTWALRNSSGSGSGLTEVRGPWGPMFGVGILAPRETLHITPELTFPRRGVFPFTSLILVSGYPFGLVRYRRRLALSGRIVVYPGAYACSAPRAAGFEPVVGGKFHGRNRTAFGDSFHGVRPLRPEDPVKLIHWPSSSKGQGIMVKEFDEELSGRVGILLDASPGRSSEEGELLLDWAARAAASLMFAALDAGHHVQFVDLAQPAVVSVPPFSDGTAVLQRLAEMQPDSECLTIENVNRAVARLPRRCALCFVLTKLPATVAMSIQALVDGGRRVSIYLPADARAPAADLPVRIHRYGAWKLDTDRA